MINLNFWRFVKKIDGVSLSEPERSSLRADFLAKTGLPTLPAEPQPKTHFVRSIFLFESFRLTAAAFLVFVFVSGSLVLVSKNSIPGDYLYPFKTDVTEQVVRAFYATSPTAKADYEVQLVDERLVEAEKLDQKEPLTGDQKVQIENQVTAQTDRAETAINTANTATTTMPIKRSEYGYLETVLKAHRDIVQKLGITGPHK